MVDDVAAPEVPLHKSPLPETAHETVSVVLHEIRVLPPRPTILGVAVMVPTGIGVTHVERPSEQYDGKVHVAYEFVTVC